MAGYRRARPNQLNQKELIALIAKKTGYLKYEVEDILEGLRYVITDAIVNDRDVYLRHLFTVMQKKIPPRNMINQKTGEYYISRGSVGMTLKISGFMRNALNGVYDDMKPRSDTDDDEDEESSEDMVEAQ